MLRWLRDAILFASFTLLLPVFGVAAWLWGSADERMLMKIVFCVLSPLCACIWYVLLSNFVFKRRSSYGMQFLIAVCGYALIALLIKSGVVTFWFRA